MCAASHVILNVEKTNLPKKNLLVCTKEEFPPNVYYLQLV